MADTTSADDLPPASNPTGETYRTTPPEIDGYPPGIPYIVGNEAAERFSFYGMKAILTVFLTTQLVAVGSNELAPMSGAEATVLGHVFVAAVYFTPLLGAFIADAYWGKYKTIMLLSIVYCFGHAALAIDLSRVGVFIGLALIAIGAGGIKPCVTAHVGDQFGARNQHLRSRVYGWFYLSVNLGAAIASVLIPRVREAYGPHLAFSIPGALMLLATILFWVGRNTFVHIPPSGAETVLGILKAPGGWKLLGRLLSVFIFVAVFWALFDQTATTWVLQADRMDRTVNLGFGETTLLPSEIQALNPIMILIFVPLFAFLVYPAIDKVFPLTPLRKVSLGMFLASTAFVVPALVEQWTTGGQLVTRLATADAEQHPGSAIIDADYEGGWLSGADFKPDDEESGPVKIVIRLAKTPESLTRVVIDPTVRVANELLPKVKLNGEETEECEPVENQYLTKVKVSVADVPEPETWRDAGTFDLAGPPNDPVDSLEWEARGRRETLILPESVAGEYLQLTLLENAGGSRVGLGSVQVYGGGDEDLAAITNKPSILWQFLAYALLTAAEVMVSITMLDFAYSQAPVAMKSLVTSLNLLMVFLGNGFTAVVNAFIVRDDGTTLLEGPAYFWFFTFLMLAAAVGFTIRAAFYTYRDYGATGEEVGSA